jgi:hypothetical protein
VVADIPAADKEKDGGKKRKDAGPRRSRFERTVGKLKKEVRSTEKGFLNKKDPKALLKIRYPDIDDQFIHSACLTIDTKCQNVLGK